MHVQHFLRLMR